MISEEKISECNILKDTGDVLSATQELEGQFADIRKQPEVEGYLAAEMELCRMVQEICMSIVEAVDFNMDFLPIISRIKMYRPCRIGESDEK